MTTIYIVLKNGDFTEGRGPMSLHKVFADYNKAVTYIKSQSGIYGSRQYDSPMMYFRPNCESWNGYDLVSAEVE